MSVVPLRRRLEALEARSVPTDGPPPVDPVRRLLEVLITHHLGAVTASESLATGFARALGYGRGGELAAGLQAEDGTAASDDLDDRWRDAVERLFALRDTQPDCDGQTFADTLESLYRAMPEWLRRHPFLGVDTEDLFAGCCASRPDANSLTR